ncbi:hypothetical protein [Nannocystis pusilla]|uniref:hypothetical protein n=1 Tax=Nannocystis pusilla TaxID=889268 RepID=UPI003B7BA92E
MQPVRSHTEAPPFNFQVPLPQLSTGQLFVAKFDGLGERRWGSYFNGVISGAKLCNGVTVDASYRIHTAGAVAYSELSTPGGESTTDDASTTENDSATDNASTTENDSTTGQDSDAGNGDTTGEGSTARTVDTTSDIGARDGIGRLRRHERRQIQRRPRVWRLRLQPHWRSRSRPARLAVVARPPSLALTSDLTPAPPHEPRRRRERLLRPLAVRAVPAARQHQRLDRPARPAGDRLQLRRRPVHIIFALDQQDRRRHPRQTPGRAARRTSRGPAS